MIQKKIVRFFAAAVSANTGLIGGVTLATTWPASHPDLRSAWVAAWVAGGQWAWLLLYASHHTRKHVRRLLQHTRETWLPAVSDRAAEELYRLLLQNWDDLLAQSENKLAMTQNILHVFREESDRLVQETLVQLDASDADWRAWVPPAALRWVPQGEVYRDTLASLEDITETLARWIDALVLEYEASRSIHEAQLAAWLQARARTEVERLAGSRLAQAETISKRAYRIWVTALICVLLAPWPAWVCLQFLLDWIQT